MRHPDEGYAAVSPAGRSLTRQEWATFVGSRPHDETFPTD